MSSPSIRPKSIAVLRDRERIFVIRATDPADGSTFYTPPGGGIEFGETARQAVTRETREELGAELDDVRQIGVLENPFTYGGTPMHEIVFVFVARFADWDFYQRESMEMWDDAAPEDIAAGLDVDGKLRLTALWLPLATFAEGGERLVPEGLLDLLEVRSATQGDTDE